MPTSPSYAAALPPNLAVLQQGLTLLARLSAEQYSRKIPVVYDASIGGHLRHILEHYQSFLCGLETGAVDYERRARCVELEQDPAIAGRVIADLIDRLHRLADGPTHAGLDYTTETSPGRLSESSLTRELEFLLSHTVHHYALVAVMCRLQGIEPETGFGVAPSTLRHQQSLAACAP